MKLYELNRGALFKLGEDAMIPPDAPEGVDGVVYKLGGLDGMYAWCLTNDDVERYYFAAWTEVEEVCQNT